MENTLYKSETPFTFKETLQYYFNMFTDKLISNSIDFQHYKNIQAQNPDYTTMNEMGQKVGVKSLVEAHRRALGYARENLAYVKELMTMEEAGTLAEVWSTEKLAGVLSPIQPGDETLKDSNPK